MTHVEEDDELLDLVDTNDNVVGTVEREAHHVDPESYVRKGQYFRGTTCILVNSQNQVWIPKRQPWRKVAPDGLDFSMAEHVKSGEDHSDGAIRGMSEELGLNVQAEELILVGKKVFDDFGCVMSLYEYRTEKTPENYSKVDYQDAWWMSLDQLEERILSGEKHKTTLPYWITVLRERFKNA